MKKMFGRLDWRQGMGALALTILPGLCVLPASVQAAGLGVFVSAQGSDANSGLSAEAPVLTLARAQAVARAAYLPGSHDAVTVNVAPGTYLGQSVTWTFVPGTVPLTIQGPEDEDVSPGIPAKPMVRPIFDGNKTARSFLTIKYRKEPTRVTVRRLFITNYLTSAIQLRGCAFPDTDCSPVDTKEAGSVIEKNVFDKIGSAWVFKSETAYSALSLSTTHNNTVRDNVFSRIADASPTAVGLHAIYAAYSSTGNQISGNVFSNIVAGDVIKFRDRSNYNRVLNNGFVNNRNWSAVYNWVQWARNANGDFGTECPNHDIFVSGNRVVMGSSAPNGVYDASKALFRNYVFDAETTYGCPPDEVQEYLDKPRTVVDVDNRQGCFVSVNNCPRMKRLDRFEFLDTVTAAHDSPQACLARAKTWFDSCSKYSIGTLQMAKARFLEQTSQAGDKVVAHGCVVTANYCPHMGFLPQESKLDWKPEAHGSEEACLDRAPSHYKACSDELTADELQNLKVRLQYFQFGNLVAEQTAP